MRRFVIGHEHALDAEIRQPGLDDLAMHQTAVDSNERDHLNT